jgi:hypothetical protein
MKILVRLVIAVALLWAAYEFGRPWLSRRLDDAGLHRRGGGPVASGCFEAVESAVSHFGEVVLAHTRPPVDLDRWSDALAGAQGRASDARDACACGDVDEGARAACGRAVEVLDELEAFQRHADDTLQSGEPPVDFARRQQELYEQLERARR